MDAPIPPRRLDSTISDEDGLVPVQGKTRPWLFVVHGSDRSRRIKLGEAPITLGRGPGADVLLNDERASKVHCAVRVIAGEAVEVVDQGSRNGTFVDGERIDRAILRPNSQLRVGHTILRDIAALGPMLPGVLHHHERWDGTGYPHGLAGQRIPLMGRVLALADTFDAMSSNRAYRPAVPRNRVLAEIQRCCGTQFDPELVGLFLALDFNAFDALLGRQAAAGDPPAPRGLAA